MKTNLKVYLAFVSVYTALYASSRVSVNILGIWVPVIFILAALILAGLLAYDFSKYFSQVVKDAPRKEEQRIAGNVAWMRAKFPRTRK